MNGEDAPAYRPIGGVRGQTDGPLPLANKRLALITGGHRRLGGVIAAGFARAGDSLAIHGSHDTRLDSALALTLDDNGTEWDGFTADFADPESAEELVAKVAERFGRPPDILVNSAAIFGQDRWRTGA